MNESTVEKMRQLKFFGMLRAFKTNMEEHQKTMTGDELVSFLIESEWDDRNNRRIQRNVQNARFRYKSEMESISYDIERNLDKNYFLRLAECTFIKKNENILITGSTGIGKSYIATALGNQACVMGYKVIYASTSKLFAKLKMAKADGSYLKEISKLERQDLLILDDFGIQPFDNQSRASLMEIIEDRHGKHSTIVTSQIPIKAWHETIGEKTIADAILDRIVHDAYRIELRGESLRKKNTNNDILEE
jgi:DNA replication protein DnaC